MELMSYKDIYKLVIFDFLDQLRKITDHKSVVMDKGYKEKKEEDGRIASER